MADIKYYDVILKPVVTEKSMGLMADKKYTFLVHTEATKSQIKEAVEKMFAGAKVAKVNTMNNEGKSKRVRGTMQNSARQPRQRRLLCSSQRTARISRFSRGYKTC